MNNNESAAPSLLNCQSLSSRDALAASFSHIRRQSELLCVPLQVEDYVVQPAAHISPPKWHLAHTTWFFENFLLVPYLVGYRQFDRRFGYLFNSYYETVGKFHPRAQRGHLTRPTVEETYQYRAYVDEHMLEMIDANESDLFARVVLGLNHEQQHQELILMDIKAIFAANPLRPVYQPSPARPPAQETEMEWNAHSGGMQMIGSDGSGFAFDNEQPRHRVYLQPYRLASRLVTNHEYLQFVEAGGYQKPEYWLADGWQTVQAQKWSAPEYWQQVGGEWWAMTLHGFEPVNGNEPVCHVSFYEADAFARWTGFRLPTEAEWEAAAAAQPEFTSGNFFESGWLHPLPTRADCEQLFGDVWQWTASAYLPYPGFKPLPNALGEYNGKFMCNQMVLRGGSCATPLSHIRASYRNFFYPADRWQFSGIRLAQ